MPTQEQIPFVKSIHNRLGYKKKFMLSSAEHEILNALNYQEIQHVSGSEKPKMLFFLLINVKMPTTVGILTFMSSKNFIFG